MGIVAEHWDLNGLLKILQSAIGRLQRLAEEDQTATGPKAQQASQEDDLHAVGLEGLFRDLAGS